MDFTLQISERVSTLARQAEEGLGPQFARIDAIAQAIADGILKTIQEEQQACPRYYQIQTGAFQNEQAAASQLESLLMQGYPAFQIHDGNIHKVRVGAFLNLDNAARMEQELKNSGYTTLIVRESDVYCPYNQ